MYLVRKILLFETRQKVYGWQVLQWKENPYTQVLEGEPNMFVVLMFELGDIYLRESFPR